MRKSFFTAVANHFLRLVAPFRTLKITKKRKKNLLQENLLIADGKVISFHERISEFFVKVNNEIAKANQEYPKPFLRGALFSMAQDVFALHQAIYSLCINGWTFAAPLLLRTQLDLLIGAGILANTSDDDQEYMGFKYTNFFIKANLHSSKISEEEKKTQRKFINEQIEKLPSSMQEKARSYFFKEKLKGYWFCPEFKNSKDALDKFSVEEHKNLIWIYDFLSGAVHGGLLGLRSFRDQPDNIHPNPRSDRKSQNLALAYSTRTLLDFAWIRGKMENNDIEMEYKEILSEFIELKKIFQN